VADTHRVLARLLCMLLLGGGSTAVVSALADPWGNRWVFATAGAGLLAAALFAVRGFRVPHRVFHVMTTASTLLITGGVVLAADTATAVVNAMLYTLVAVVLFSYYARQDAAVHLVVLLAAAGAAGEVRGFPPLTTVAMVCALTAASLAVRGLALRAAAAGRDPLTDLLNRRGFERVLEELASEPAAAGAPISLVLLDVDRFTEVNERLGQAGGDALLHGLAVDLHAALPADAVLGRLGGDEFAVVLRRTGDDTALVVVETARRAARHPLSAGVAARLPGEPLGEWLRRADAALAEAKQLGRDRSVLADAATAHLTLGLAAALADRDAPGLRVELQPVVAVGTGRPVAVEALVRWDHPVRGAVPPQQFVGVAERAGLVPALGAFVLRRACRAVRDLRDHVAPDLALTVNASGNELVDPGYTDGVLGVLAEAGLPPQALVVEVTESVVEGTSPAALLTVDRLRQHGVRVAIDDFGAGYSTYSRLDTLPADFLKLDGALLDGATSSTRRRALLESAVSVGRALGLVVIVEGVETQEQADLLVELGCPLAQGYFYSRPRRPEQLLAEWSTAPAPVAVPGGDPTGRAPEPV